MIVHFIKWKCMHVFSMNMRTMQEGFYLASERAQFTICIDVLQTKRNNAVEVLCVLEVSD